MNKVNKELYKVIFLIVVIIIAVILRRLEINIPDEVILTLFMTLTGLVGVTIDKAKLFKGDDK